MSAYPFGSGMYYYVGAMLKRAKKKSCSGKSIVNNKRYVILFGYGSYSLKIRDTEIGITDSFCKNRFGVFVNKTLYTGCFIVFGKFCFNNKTFERYFKLVVRTAV
jgi:hypothetical protein